MVTGKGEVMPTYKNKGKITHEAYDKKPKGLPGGVKQPKDMMKTRKVTNSIIKPSGVKRYGISNLKRG